MANSGDTSPIKLVATCRTCGRAIKPGNISDDDSLCLDCADDEDADDDGGGGAAREDGGNARGEVDAAGRGAENAGALGAAGSAGLGSCGAEGAYSGTESGAKLDSEKSRLHDDDLPDNFEILEVLPECSHGKALIVFDTKLQAKLLLRFITVGVARMTGGLPIETVSQLLVQQNHAHLTTVYDCKTFNGKNCLVLDAPADKNLETIIQTEGFLDLPRALDIFIQVCEALEELHKTNILHGFLRPCSIGILEQEKVDVAKVTNFSITNVCSNNLEKPLKVKRNYTCNDVFYMSPEEIEGGLLSVSADIYSLGCVIFHAITGKPVYRARTLADVKKQHLEHTSARFSERYDIPPDVQSVVLRMLEPVPSNRYKTVRAVRKDLERLRDKKPPILEDKWKGFMALLGG